MTPLNIVGQGLTGTALAWRCYQRRIPFRIYDQPRSPTASQIAAGLVTPISGQRLVLSQGWTFLEDMETFYADIGQVLQRPFYHRRPAVRILVSDQESLRWNRRQCDPLYQHEVSPLTPTLPTGILTAPHGAFTMHRSGLLTCAAWLQISRAWFRHHDFLTEAEIHPLETASTEGTWIFANGPWLLSETAFDWLPLRYAHGDILTLSIPDLREETRLFHAGCWLIPLGSDLWKAGATYEPRPRPHTHPSPEGRAKLEAALRLFLKCPYAVEDHVAAVRPVTLTRFPTMGRHPAHPHLAWFGGFSSKAVLTAPTYANHFLDHLLQDRPLPPETEMD